MDLTLDGAPVYLVAAGPPSRDRPILLLHGAGFDHSIWAAQIAALAAIGAAVLAPDLPGHGRSAGAPLTRIEDMAHWTLRLVEALGLARPALAGHSMGAMVALEAAARPQAAISGLALLGAALSMPVNPRLLGMARDDLAAAAALIASWAYGPEAAARGLPGHGIELLRRSAPGVLAADLAACDAYRLAPAAEHIVCPTVILAGRRDRMVPPHGAAALAARIAGARLIELPQAGHMLTVEEPAAVGEALAGLISVPRPPAKQQGRQAKRPGG